MLIKGERWDTRLRLIMPVILKMLNYLMRQSFKQQNLFGCAVNAE